MLFRAEGRCDAHALERYLQLGGHLEVAAKKASGTVARLGGRRQVPLRYRASVPIFQPDASRLASPPARTGRSVYGFFFPSFFLSPLIGFLVVVVLLAREPATKVREVDSTGKSSPSKTPRQIP